MEQTSFCHLDMLFRGAGLVKAVIALLCESCDLLWLLPNTTQLNALSSFSKGELEESSLGLLWLMKSPNWLKNVLSWITKPFVRSISL